ncbi:MAG: endonuclease III [Dehalococcoidia bacterium]|nr:endonuclease III [Dehalococcoidia bacterium]
MAYPAASLDSQPARKAAHTINRRLLEEYGHHPWQPRLDPLSELIYTILSQNTSDVNSHRAFQRLRAAFPTWEKLMAAPVEEIAGAIQVGGLAFVKAPRIKAVLTRIAEERGSLDLSFLRDMEAQQARAWLRELPGVGAKTASIVLLFALGKPALPVDTHVHRVSRRLGLIGERDSAEKAHDLLEALLHPNDYYDFHVNVLTHGRRVCTARNPRCTVCVVNGLCPAYQRFLKEGVPVR